ncbi:hypothetical protein PHLCEN_2v12002 [Hermanssonia centrifuga]|uniref:C2H2-type domain-containing protein n=1 Tax=Hermanssonia centrifuga TaxID=98765 RepID=A0A2R6NJE0_9APHY|nr:hypothetical protein PHLCEN_2v12002 [Hermanssonia centrifuga]
MHKPSGDTKPLQQTDSGPTKTIWPDIHFCLPCDREFKDAEALKMHLNNSSAHPMCTFCSVGFQDTSAYEEHVQMTHKLQIDSKPTTPSPIILRMTTPSSVLPDATPFKEQEPVVVHPAESTIEEATTPVQEGFSLDSPKSDVPELQRALVLRIPDPVPQRVRASSEPPLSSLYTPRDHATVSDAGTVGSMSGAWTNDESIISQAETLPSPTSSSHSQSLGDGSATPSPIIRPQSLPQPVSPMPPLPPLSIPPVASLEETSQGRNYPHKPVGAQLGQQFWRGESLASESTSGPATPTSPHSLISALRRGIQRNGLPDRVHVRTRATHALILAQREHLSHVIQQSRRPPLHGHAKTTRRRRVGVAGSVFRIRANPQRLYADIYSAEGVSQTSYLGHTPFLYQTGC